MVKKSAIEPDVAEHKTPEPGNTVAIKASEIEAVTSVQLDEHQTLVQLEKMLRGAVDEWKERLANVQAQLQELVGDAEEATVDGKQVFTFSRINRLREQAFRKAYPTMAQVYTDVVEVEKLNVDSLRANQPEIYREFQSRVWKRVD